jgi:hypothetical protein
MPTLESLAPEIRNNIYGYLFSQASLRWKHFKPHATRSQPRDAPELPKHLSILLTSKLLYSETRPIVAEYARIDITEFLISKSAQKRLIAAKPFQATTHHIKIDLRTLKFDEWVGISQLKQVLANITTIQPLFHNLQSFTLQMAHPAHCIFPRSNLKRPAFLIEQAFGDIFVLSNLLGCRAEHVVVNEVMKTIRNCPGDIETTICNSCLMLWDPQEEGEDSHLDYSLDLRSKTLQTRHRTLPELNVHTVLNSLDTGLDCAVKPCKPSCVYHLRNFGCR